MSLISVDSLAQLEGSLITSEGLQHSEALALLIEDNGLMALAQGAQAALALEVLQDDMAINMPVALEQSANKHDAVASCLQESLENIDEFIRSKEPTGEGVQLAVVQPAYGYFNAFVSADMCVAVLHADKLDTLCDDAYNQPIVGSKNGFAAYILKQEYRNNDLLMLASRSTFSTLDADFIRVTLARFRDNLHMALRQLNTRAMRNGLAKKPVMMLCRLQGVEKSTASGWFKRKR